MQVKRTRYLTMLNSGKNLNDVVKVVTGMRRVGKSTLLEQFASQLIADGVQPDSIHTINFESFEYQNIGESAELNEWLKTNIPADGQQYIILDEIQNVRGWEMSVSALQIRKNCDVYITGSNSKMLSSELATHLSGRYVLIEVMPLSFGEYLELYPSDNPESRFGDYMRYGGLPAINPDFNPKFITDLLDGIYSTVVLKDVLARIKTDDVYRLESIVRFLFSNIGNVTNTDSVAKTLGISNATVSKYMRELRSACLFEYTERYDITGKKLLKTNGKYYATDLGLRNAVLGFGSAKDIGRMLENLVFLELKRRGYIVRTGSYYDSEIDFVAKSAGSTVYIQVCQTLMSEETYSREIRPLGRVRDNCRKIILTTDRLGLGSDEGIEIINIMDWLLDS